MHICGYEKTAGQAISLFYLLYRTIFLIKLEAKAQKVKKFHKSSAYGKGVQRGSARLTFCTELSTILVYKVHEFLRERGGKKKTYDRPCSQR